MMIGLCLLWLAAAPTPITFEPNRGQSDPAVRFIAHADDYALFLTGKAARLVLTQQGRDPAQLSLVFDGALAARLKGLADPNVHGYSRVLADEIYPGIDLEYSASPERALAFLLRVHAGARPGRVALRFDGASEVRLDDSGALIAKLGDGQHVRLSAPRAYQLAGKRKQPVAVRFVFDAEKRVRLMLGRYDRSRPVIIHSR